MSKKKGQWYLEYKQGFVVYHAIKELKIADRCIQWGKGISVERIQIFYNLLNHWVKK